MNTMEIRSFSTELRAANAMKIGGIAVPWDSFSENLPGSFGRKCLSPSPSVVSAARMRKGGTFRSKTPPSNH